MGVNDGTNVAVGSDVIEKKGSRDGVEAGVRVGEGKGATEGASLGFAVGIIVDGSVADGSGVGCEEGSTVSN